jgi:hypothetical protein
MPIDETVPDAVHYYGLVAIRMVDTFELTIPSRDP